MTDPIPIHDAARKFHINPATITALITTGHLTTHRHPTTRQPLIDPDELDNLLYPPQGT